MRRRPSGSSTTDVDREDAEPESRSAQSLSATDASAITREAERQEESVRNSRRASARRAQEQDRPPGKLDKKGNAAWDHTRSHEGASEKEEQLALSNDITSDAIVDMATRRRQTWRSPWSCSLLSWAALSTAVLLILCMWQSFTTRQLDPKGADMSYMASAFVRFPDFDTEHTRFATKYSLYMYREMGVDDEDPRVKGVPVLFIPGNAGSYKQVRSLASEAAHFWNNQIRPNPEAVNQGKVALDFFTVDFNEDLTAFHGQTLLDQAEYLNDAVAYILSLYHNPEKSIRDSSLPDPSAVMLVGHSMGGVAARTMLTMPNYQANSVNTIITLSAPHARAPVSFDAQIIKTYAKTNEYWRKAHSTRWGSDNPLWHVTLISIAGGGLDTIVPSDYSSLASLVPETHGFTVFTSTIPDVWIGMDHLAITWCDQFRKVVIKSMYDVLDASRAAQTKPRGERMRSFKKWFLTGLEDVAERTLPQKEPKTLLTLEDNSNAIVTQGERFVLRGLGHQAKKQAHLLPIPPHGTTEGRKFTLLTDQHLDTSNENGTLEVLFCSVFPLQLGNSATLFSMNMDLSGDSSGSTRLACKNAASDTIRLPASNRHSRYAFDKSYPLSYLQYELEDLSEHQFVAIVDKADHYTPGWVIAEFNPGSESVIRSSIGYRDLLSSNLETKLPASRSTLMEIKVPGLSSGLLAYKLKVGKQSCGEDAELFTPLVRQYVSDVYESKFFVNVKEIDINLHGVAPYMPPALRGGDASKGLALQIWSDPTCNSSIEVTLSLDVAGSFGKLWMRYRTLFATLPLVVVALALCKQFKTYDEEGVFMSFSQSLSQCLSSSIPITFLALTAIAMFMASRCQAFARTTDGWPLQRHSNATESIIDYTRNDMLIGSPDAFFWFLLPFFGLISVGLCIAINHAALAITCILAAGFALIKSTPRSDDGRRTPAAFAVTSTRQRIITTAILLILVSTAIPYQFAFLVLCLVQIASCVRAFRVAKETRTDANFDFYNYSHSILTLMLWVLPINIPVLVVWIRNLAVHWLTPFSSHHNILSIMPYILLVETLSTGRMIPRVPPPLGAVTQLFLLSLAACAALYGVSYAYYLHHVVNAFCAWLVLVHWSTPASCLSSSGAFPGCAPPNQAATKSADTAFPFTRLKRLLVDVAEGEAKKRP